MSRKPEEVKEYIDTLVVLYEGGIFDNQKAKGATVGLLNKVCGSDGRRRLLLKYLFGKESSKLLSGAEWYALTQWIDSQQVGEKYLHQNDLYEEVRAILGEETGITELKLPELYQFD